jgi:tetraacyldisaccharide 4'-kinase
VRARPALAPLLPLSWLYGWALARKNAEFASGRRRVERLRWPVVSVGNLSVGGSGKTPVVMRLAELLAHAGVAVDVLSRGYGRSARTVAQVDPAGDAKTFGDEPLLIAHRTGVPVFVGASRFAAGTLAESVAARETEPRVHLLDDGFQHRRLARAVEIVLLHRTDFDSALLPAGRLREPLSALERADIVILREEDAVYEAEARRWAGPDTLFWRVQRKISVAVPEGPVVAFCAIARADEFFAKLVEAGLQIATVRAWRDHHPYTPADLRNLGRLAERSGAKAFVTTAKDAVRLEDAWRKELSAAMPLTVAELEVRFEAESEAITQLLRLLRTRAPGFPG